MDRHTRTAARRPNRWRDEIATGSEIVPRISNHGGLARGAGRRVNARDSFSGYREKPKRIGFSQVLLGRERETRQIGQRTEVVGMNARRVEFSLVIGIVCIGVPERGAQALELQALELVAARAQNRLHGHELLDCMRTHRSGHPSHYSDLSRSKSGRRFSRAAANPSRTSASLKPRNSSASEVSKLGPANRSQLFSACLVQRIAVVLPAASVRATSNALSSTWASGTATATRPMRSASAPDRALS